MQSLCSCRTLYPFIFPTQKECLLETKKNDILGMELAMSMVFAKGDDLSWLGG